MVTQFLKIGVDGGGSKTELILVDPAGAIVARHTAAGTNPSLVGPELAGSTLRAALDELLAQSPSASDQIASTRLFMAGSPPFWRQFAESLQGFGEVVAADDSLPVVELATKGAPGLILHAGTGSFVAARAADGALHYAGGLGWKLGDPGSAFDVGRRGIARGLLELQGWLPPTPLAEALVRHAGLGDAAMITRLFYSADDANVRIGAFAPVVTDLAAQGCHPAQLVLVESITGLVELARGVTSRLFKNQLVTCGVSGALLNSAPAVHTLRSLVTTHTWPVGLCFIAEPPIEGVRRLLAKAR
ncbi:MAG: ATPase [Opitutae bacterium]|nr:ATPase [Opitutae bacterium]